MIAVIVSAVVVLYVLVPSGIFRIITSLAFPVKLPKTRTQELTFAAVFSLLPFLLALAFSWTGWPFPTREDLVHRRTAYRTIFASLASDKQLDNAVAAGDYWWSVNSALRRQFRFLSWDYAFVGLQAWGFSQLAGSYRRKGRRLRDRAGRVVMKAAMSEWAVLLTNVGSPKADIDLDLLSTDGILYQGRLNDYFFNGEGDLSGVLLGSPARYDREQYSAHQKKDLEAICAKWPEEPVYKFIRDTTSYWKRIPGADLFYIPRERIANINVRHVTPPAEVAKAAEERLDSRKIKINGVGITVQPQQFSSGVAQVKATGTTGETGLI